MTAGNYIYDLAKYALGQMGAQLQFGGELTEESAAYACVLIPGASWTEFFKVDRREDGYFGLIPVFQDKLEEHQKQHSVIEKSNWTERDGHIYMNVPLDGSIPSEYLKGLIDDAYQIAWDKLSENARFLIDQTNKVYDEPKLIDRLIDQKNLQEYGSVIHGLIRPGILLRTTSENEAYMPLGATKIGGLPDLPIGTTWPEYADGRPLAFLTQIDLAEISKLGPVIEGLPDAGLLSLFSVWGWTSDDDFDPQKPDHDWEEQTGWSVVLHSAPGETLTRLNPPKAVNTFPAASVEHTPILSLPNSHLEPSVAALNWPEDVYEEFDSMQFDFRAIQMNHWVKNLNGFNSHHLLGGYALFQQQYPEEILEKGKQMLLQIGTDTNVDMWWGDAGELTFYTDTKAIKEGKFERIWGTCQGG